MPLSVTQLPREFTAKIKGKEIKLPDPNTDFTEDMVLNHYANMYPELITAQVGASEIKDDKLVYRFETTMGTKG